MTKEEIGLVLKELRVSCKMTQKEVAEKIGRTQQIVGHWETGYAQPDANTLFTLCSIYGVTVDDAFGFQRRDSISKEDYERIRKYKLISDYSPDGASVVDTVLDREYAIAEKLKKQTEEIQKVNVEFSSEIVPMRPMAYYQKMASAGSGEYLFNDIPTDVIEVPETTLSRRANFVLGVNGNSMETTYFDGDKVLVEKAQDVPIGAIGVFIREGECFIKEAGKDRLISHNEDKKRYPDIIPDERRIDTVGIVLGKVGE